jgi:hypothetical protein
MELERDARGERSKLAHRGGVHGGIGEQINVLEESAAPPSNGQRHYLLLQTFRTILCTLVRRTVL